MYAIRSYYEFDEAFISNGKLNLGTTFSELIYQIREFKPTQEFASAYIENANQFLEKVKAYRNIENKPVNI